MKNVNHLLSKNEQPRPKQKYRQALPVALMVIGSLALALVLVIAFTSNWSGKPAIQPIQVGAMMRDFTLTDITGQKVRLRDYRGQMVLLNAWATWCPPCRAEMPGLNAYYQDHAGEGFVILAINAGDPAEDAAAFAQAYGLAFPVLLDPQTELLDSLPVHDYPTSILIGRDGVIRGIHIGMLSAEQLEVKISPFLQQ